MDSLSLLISSLSADFSYTQHFKEKPEHYSNIQKEIITVIINLEKALILGLLQCISSLLYTLLVLPIKSIIFPTYSNASRTITMIGVSLLLSYYLSVSRLYHDLKEQDFLKLSAVYNMIGVADRLLIAFGQKSIKQLSNSFENFFVFFVYVSLHSVHLSLALTVFEVALNSGTSNLILVVVTAAFVELKIVIFKKNDKKTLMTVMFYDIIERLQLLLYLFTIIFKALLRENTNIDNIVKGCMIVLVTSIGID